MSGSLNIYPFEDAETTIRFVIQISLFLIGLFLTNKMIIRPALKLQAERKKRTLGNQQVAQSKLQQANELEQTYKARLNQTLENARALQEEQIKSSKEAANKILVGAQNKAGVYMAEIKENLRLEKQEASSQIHLHINDIVKKLYSKLGVNA